MSESDANIKAKLDKLDRIEKDIREHMSEKPKLIRMQITIDKATDDLVRAKFHHKGDLSKAVTFALWNTYGPEAVKPLQAIQTT
jgi:hypothetical protein